MPCLGAWFPLILRFNTMSTPYETNYMLTWGDEECATQIKYMYLKFELETLFEVDIQKDIVKVESCTTRIRLE